MTPEKWAALKILAARIRAEHRAQLARQLATRW